MKTIKKLVALLTLAIPMVLGLCTNALGGNDAGFVVETIRDPAPQPVEPPSPAGKSREVGASAETGLSNKSPVESSRNSSGLLRGLEKTIKIVVDAGHGGRDLGAQGLNSVSEKEICLKVSRMVRREIQRVQKLSDLPIEVVLSRDGDDFVSLHDRVRFANEGGADLFVSIHANSSPVPKAHGFEVYFLSPEPTDEEASKLARLENQAPTTPISAQVISILSDATTQYHVAESSRLAETMFSAISRRIVSSGRGVRQAPFTVLHGTNMPAVLIEMGYVTHSDESKNLTKDTYLKRVAGAISSGIIDFASKRRKL